MVSFPTWCRMKSRWVLAALLSGMPLYAWQGNTPQAALEEIATATKPEAIARHLPEPVQKSIEVLPQAQKRQVMQQLLEIKATQLGGCTVKPANDSDGWEILDADGDSKGKVKLANAFISGTDALLPLEIDMENGPQSFIVTMHLEDGEWRIDNFGAWDKSDLGLDKLVHQPTEMEKNEAAARETLQQLRRALHSYAYGHPTEGFPHDLRVLTEPQRHGETEFAAALDESFAADPLVKDGYRFTYVKTDAGSGTHSNLGDYQVTAMPVEYGKTGSRSFLLTFGETHSTTSNRPATPDDPPGWE